MEDTGHSAEKHHSIKSAAVAVTLRRLFPHYYTVKEMALLVARDRCAPSELRAADTPAQIEALARLAHDRETR